MITETIIKFNKVITKAEIKQCSESIKMLQERKNILVKVLQDSCKHTWFTNHDYDGGLGYFCKNCGIKFCHNTLKSSDCLSLDDRNKNTSLLRSICKNIKQRELIELEKALQDSIGKIINYPFQRKYCNQLMKIKPNSFNPQTLEIDFDIGIHINIKGYISICTDPEWPYLNEKIIINPKHKGIFTK